MRNRSKIGVGMVLLVLLSTAVAWGWMAHVRGVAFDKYGERPLMQISYAAGSEDRSPPYCLVVRSISPPSHYNWRGEVWVDESIDWEDILLESPPGTALSHGKAGPARVGDEVCGADDRFYAIFRPTGELLMSVG